jgi:para-nitrobenzyl esterase
MPTDSTVVVETASGAVVGRRDGPIVRFGGVPYAQAARWESPAPSSWSEPLDATDAGAAPPQSVSGLDLVPGMVPSRQTEACLTLDVCTRLGRSGTDPALEGARAVLLWVPGGSFLIGGGSLPVYDGAHLAERDVVAVAMNYRLGALGWLAADGVPSNLGLRDLRAAIEWLRANAPAFGGDPDRIVLMGESAGSGCIAHLLASDPDLPIAGAILQSGAPASTLDAERAALVGARFLEAAGATSVGELRDAPVDVILAAQDAAVRASQVDIGAMPFHPWIDGEMLQGAAHLAKFAPVPLVVGTTAHEMELFRAQMPQLTEELTLVAATRSAARLGITDETRVQAAVDAAGGDFVTATSDLELNLPNELLARQHAARGNRVYRYRFTWEAPVLRACHALDLPFTFGTLDSDTWREFAGADDARADALSDRMQTAWTSFASTLVPSDHDVGDWSEGSIVMLGRDPAEKHDDEVGRRLNIWLGEG